MLRSQYWQTLTMFILSYIPKGNSNASTWQYSTNTYPPSTGRNFKEILRVIDSLQLTDNYSVATPVDWVDGDDVVVAPSISTEDAKQKFPKGVTELKSYLRMTPQPK